jgi:NADP-dependent 3-hydroxy acid dehydrogenase YdfG
MRDQRRRHDEGREAPTEPGHAPSLPANVRAMQPITDRVFVVTGAGGAIAAPIVSALAGAGARLALVDRHEDLVRARAAAVAGMALAADLTRVAGAEAMVRAVAEKLGPIDGLVHTVGGFAMGKLVDSDEATYERMFDGNVRALYATLRAVVPGMQARGRGFIAAFSSEPGWSGRSPGTALYGAAKAAATSLLRSLDQELAGSDVAVAIVYPMGAVDTPANRRDMPGVDPETFIDPQEIAETIVHAAQRGPRGRLRELPVFPPRR